ncbi:MAG TPA: SDR family oxidoreductase [Sphingomonadaceae bacterium]|nr:SDR family oxidoreductase [Sphingomonadaceae bacterium]
METLDGKVALISGAVSGIGLGIAKAFVDRGVKVALGYRREDHRDQAMRYFARRPDAEVLPVKLDVTDRAEWERAADQTEARFGKLHILVNNAGTTFPGTIDQATPSDWEWIMQVNFYGVVHGVSACIPRIRRHGEGGHIVNVSSMAAYLPAGEVGLYSTSKFAVRGLTASLQPALAADNIGVSELAPGLTRSNIHHAAEKRPARYGDTQFKPDTDFTRAFGEIMRHGMDPDEVGRKTIAGILANQPVIFSHPEFREELREMGDALVAAFPDEAVPPERLAIEERRRASATEGGTLVRND